MLAVQGFYLLHTGIYQLLLKVWGKRFTLLGVGKVTQTVDETCRQADVVVAEDFFLFPDV